MDKYYQILGKVLSSGKMQSNKKGNIRYLLNEQLTLLPADLLDIFEGHTIARKKLKNELQLFMRGERNVEKYREAGINWWDYCGSILVNSYPTYFEKLPPLIERINREKRNSKNYILFLGSTGTESNQAPCLSLVQFQIEQGELVMTALYNFFKAGCRALANANPCNRSYELLNSVVNHHLKKTLFISCLDK